MITRLGLYEKQTGKGNIYDQRSEMLSRRVEIRLIDRRQFRSFSSPLDFVVVIIYQMVALHIRWSRPIRNPAFISLAALFKTRRVWR